MNVSKQPRKTVKKQTVKKAIDYELTNHNVLCTPMGTGKTTEIVKQLVSGDLKGIILSPLVDIRDEQVNLTPHSQDYIFTIDHFINREKRPDSRIRLRPNDTIFIDESHMLFNGASYRESLNALGEYVVKHPQYRYVWITATPNKVMRTKFNHYNMQLRVVQPKTLYCSFLDNKAKGKYDVPVKTAIYTNHTDMLRKFRFDESSIIGVYGNEEFIAKVERKINRKCFNAKYATEEERAACNCFIMSSKVEAGISINDELFTNVILIYDQYTTTSTIIQVLGRFRRVAFLDVKFMKSEFADESDNKYKHVHDFLRYFECETWNENFDSLTCPNFNVSTAEKDYVSVYNSNRLCTTKKILHEYLQKHPTELIRYLFDLSRDGMALLNRVVGSKGVNELINNIDMMHYDEFMRYLYTETHSVAKVAVCYLWFKKIAKVINNYVLKDNELKERLLTSMKDAYVVELSEKYGVDSEQFKEKLNKLEKEWKTHTLNLIRYQICTVLGDSFKKQQEDVVGYRIFNPATKSYRFLRYLLLFDCIEVDFKQLYPIVFGRKLFNKPDWRPNWDMYLAVSPDNRPLGKRNLNRGLNSISVWRRENENWTYIQNRKVISDAYHVTEIQIEDFVNANLNHRDSFYHLASRVEREHVNRITDIASGLSTFRLNDALFFMNCTNDDVNSIMEKYSWKTDYYDYSIKPHIFKSNYLTEAIDAGIDKIMTEHPKLHTVRIKKPKTTRQTKHIETLDLIMGLIDKDTINSDVNVSIGRIRKVFGNYWKRTVSRVISSGINDERLNVLQLLI